MNIRFSIFFVLLVITSFYSCKEVIRNDLKYYQTINDSIQEEFAPDKRVAIYKINIEKHENEIELSGETDKEEALASLVEILKSKEENIINKVVILPDSSVGSLQYALVNNSVANIRSKDKHSAELATQAILGTALKVLKIKGDFYLVQTPDRYISWVDHGGVSLLTREAYDNWKEAPKIIFTKNFGFVYKEVGHELDKISDIVMGSQLVLLDETDSHYKVQYPDKRQGYIKKSEAQPYTEWIKEIKASGTLLELYAKELTGAPYLWGGTSTKGMDCSGFTKTVYLMNGYIIPRDASQQITAGKDIDPQLKFSGLKKGDLMFFGKKATESTRQRVTHVGIWLGNGKGEFIHSSGRVKMSSIDQNSAYYDEFNKNRYLGSRRYLGQEDELIIDLRNLEQESRIKS